MTSKMLIDTVHPEETRVALLNGDRVEDFDFESAARKQLRGNIYLAKVARVEPSLQAAFVDYGGNRHGFLAFSEIHPDYYQIPVADRQELLRIEEEEQKSEAIEDDREHEERPENGASDKSPEGSDKENGTQTSPEEAEAAADDATHDDDANGNGASTPEDVATNDAYAEVPPRRARRARSYKIQEVIKRRQILLVQVVKEERGNKGAALTTYLSLAGRYSVLMPNTARGGGISRKIANATDRKRMKTIAGDLEVPTGMGVILRTAGANRTKAEIRRDFEYLLRLWETVRTLTLESHAPRLVYEEGNLVKRAIRDLYSKDVDEVLVSGEDGYRDAKDLMRMLMPSHAKNVKLYKDVTPLFVRYGIEAQLDGLFVPQVTLKSGGYIVINQTEALVAIDVNSGRATREHNIEDTALKTNLEAAAEVARQLRLRDLAGLIVVDFIDMEENRNNRAVEKKIKEALKADRARIQVGRISSFGLLEMSRQRLRSSVLEGSTDICPHCSGTGLVRSVESVTLHVLRIIELAVKDTRSNEIKAFCAPDAAFYILNHKREYLRHFEDDYGIVVHVVGDPGCSGIECRVESAGEPVKIRTPKPMAPVKMEATDEPDAETAADGDGTGDGGERKRRRRRRRKGRGDKQEAAETGDTTRAEATDGDEDGPDDGPSQAEARSDDEEQRPRRSRRRGRRGGRRARSSGGDNEEAAATSSDDDAANGQTDNDQDDLPATDDAPAQAAEAAENGDDASEKPRRSRRARKPRARSTEPDQPDQAEADGETAKADGPDEVRPIELADEKAPETQPDEIPATPSADASDVDDTGPEEADGAQPAAEEKPAEPGARRSGWWQRAFSAKS